MARGQYYRIGKKDTTSDYLSISIAAMNRHNAFCTGQHSWGWNCNGETLASISFQVTEDKVTFLYTSKNQDGIPLDINKPIPLTWTSCNFGGLRKWFVCDCGSRVGRLFFNREHIACRDCLELVYVSQRQGEIDRLWNRIKYLESKLIDGCFRPKGMHRKTFELLKEGIEDSYMMRENVISDIVMKRFPEMVI